MPLSEATLKRYIEEGKPRSICHDGKRYYLSKEKIKQFQEKQGGILPLLALLPAILGGIGAAAGVGTAVAKGVETSNRAKHERKMEELEREKLEVMKKAGDGVVVDIAEKLEEYAKKAPEAVRDWFLKNLASKFFNVKREGNGLILRPKF